MSDTIKLRYSSPKSIAFNGVIDTGISREDWNEYDDATKDEVVQEFANELVDVSVVDE